MPSREEMISFIQGQMANGAQPVNPGAAKPSREEMVSFIQSKMGQQNKTEDSGFSPAAANAGYGNSLTMGYADKIGAAIAPAVDWGIQKFTGLRPPDDTYDQRVSDTRAYREDLRAKNPKSYMAGEVAGTVQGATALGAGLKSVGVLSKVAPLAEGATSGARWANAGAHAVQAAREGIIYGALMNPNEDGKDRSLEENVAKRIENAGTYGAVSAAFPVAGRALRETGGAIASAPKKILSTLSGVSEQNIDKYLMNADRINAQPKFSDMKNDLDQVVQDIHDDVANKKITVDEAKAAFDENRQAVIQSKFGNYKDAKTAVKEAEQKLGDAFDKAKTELKDNPPPTHLAGDVTQAVEDLKDKVVKGSEDAMSILEKEGKPVSLAGIPQKMDNIADNLKVEGKFATPGAERAYGMIKAYQQKLYELPSTISGPSAKKILKQLDMDIGYAARNGQFTDVESRALQSVRSEIDGVLKTQSPAYASKMGEVANDAELLRDTSRKYGDASQAASRLNGIGAASREPERQTLAELGKRTGRDFKTPVDDYLAASERAKNPEFLEKARQSLPEFQDVAKANQNLGRAQAQADRSLIDRNLEFSKQAKAVESATADYNAAKESLKKNAPGVTTNTTESLMKQVMRNNSITSRQKLEWISQMSGRDFTQAMDDMGVRESFKKANMNGSRNVNFWAIMGHVLRPVAGAAGGYMYDGTGGAFEGAAMGAAMGMVMDKYGPAVAKKILDVALKFEGRPTVQAIQKLDVPDGVKQELSKMLRREGTQAISGRVAQSDQPTKGPDKWANDGFQNLLDHAQTQKQRQDLLDNKDAIMKAKRQLLIKASDLKPGSKAMDDLFGKVRGGVNQ